MKVLDIINELKASKIFPKLEGEQLKLIGETSNLRKELIDVIKARKGKIVDFLREATKQAVYQPIPVVEQQASYPLSNAQQRLWVLSQFEGGSVAYNIVKGFYLQGTVNKVNLEKAFQATVQRHDSLRTVFREVEGEPRQLVLSEIGFALEHDNIEAVANKKERLEAELARLTNEPYDLTNGPLLKVKLVQLSATEFALFFGMHHIVSDGWSFGVIVQEVMAFYESLCKGEAGPAAPLAVQYKDYAAWMTTKLTGESGEKYRKFWMERLEESLDPLQLPTDFVRPENKGYKGALAKFSFNAALYQRMNSFCKESHVTLFSLLHATLNLLLYKYSGQKQLIVGTPVSGRSHYDLENQVGLYVNTLALKTSITPEQSFAAYLKETAQSTLQAFEHQDYPFDKLVEELNLVRDPSRNPLFDVMIVLQNTAFGDGSIQMTKQYGFRLLELNDYFADGAGLESIHQGAKFDLSFSFSTEAGNQFVLEIDYSTELFSEAKINRFFQAFLSLLQQAIAAPYQHVGELQLIQDAEKAKILTQFNVPIEGIDEASMISLLTESFRTRADEVALITKDKTLTYRELNEQSDRLAVYLRSKLGTADNPFVGILMQRTAWTIVSVLGILKAGAAYVPVDPTYPQNRIDFILEDADPLLILSDTASSPLIPAIYEGRVINLNTEAATILATEGEMPNAGDLREKTSYLIYTSGSTGKPKGVQICHRNAIAFLKWCCVEFAHTPYELLYAATSYCFDLSVYEFFFPLIQGKKIRLLSSALELPQYLPHDKDILVNTVPSVVRNLLEDSVDLSNVVALNMAGEPVPKKFKKDLDYRRMEVRNLYGPSEDTTYSTNYRFADDGYEIIPIGSAVGYTQMYILDESRNLLPEGVDGEIYLSGQSIAKGYHGRPDLTAERFMPNPFAPGHTMYKTGDIGRWLPDGQVEFIGRVDDQVKVRGYRIELGEIQFLLEQQDGVQQAVVVVKDIQGEKTIVAYWEGSEEQSNKELKAALGKSLPAYMVPTYWVKMDKIPLNSNGKVDKKMLPLPAQKGAEAAALVEPTTELEIRLQQLWKEVLSKKEVGIRSNFFEIGGHSLRATRLKSLVLKRLGKDISLNELFQYPTIEQQAKLLERKNETRFREISLADQSQFYPVSFTQERLWVLTSFEEASVAYHMPAAFRVQGTLDVQLLEQAFQQVIARHESLRTTFTEHQGTPVQLIHEASAIDFAIQKLAVDANGAASQLEDVLQEQWNQPFNLEKGPLLRSVLIDLAGQEQILSFCMHHIISDGWSIGVLVKEVMQAYAALAQGQEAGWAPLTLQYKDFAVWQRQELSNEKLDDHRRFWLGEFDNLGATLQLPADFDRPAIKTYHGGTTNIVFDPAVAGPLKQLANSADLSLFMVLLGGVNVLLSKYSGQRDITVGTPVAGRDHIQLEDQIGFYVNTLAIRNELSDDQTFLALARQQKDKLLNAFEHQVYPFEMLLADLNLKRDLSRSPLFDVMVIMQNTEASKASQALSSALQFEKLELNTGVTKYDLTFCFSEEADGLRLSLEYNTDLYQPATIARLAQHLTTLLEQVAANPALRLSEVNVLAAAATQELLALTDNRAAGFDQSATVVSRFQDMARTHANQVAVVTAERSLTYAELDERSGQLARVLLTDYGVLPEAPVALSFQRTEWQVIGLLAALKAGAAAVALDPADPATRLDCLVQDSGARLVLTDGSMPKEVAESGVAAFLDITTAAYRGDAVTTTLEPRHLALVLYTSDASGNPKGVEMEHRNLISQLSNAANVFGFRANDRWSVAHNLSSDLGVAEVLGALLHGATAVLAPAAATADNAAFWAWLQEQEITVLHQPTAAFRSLNAELKKQFAASPLAVRRVLLAGDDLQPEAAQDWNQAYPNSTIAVLYGRPETTGFTTWKELTAQEINAGKSSHIGRVLPTLSAVVLDANQRLVPQGATGELYVGGAAVARGYHARPELTTQRFVENPFRAGETLFRTGDRARVLASGELELVGRPEGQATIQGQRIELGEVEAALRQLEDVQEATVLATRTATGELELTGYYVLSNLLSAKAIKKALATTLPAALVPASLIRLDAFPLTSQGTIDRAALPRPNDAGSEPLTDYVAPRNEVDERLIVIWQNILETDSIGIKDNFFDLGGHSLKATRVLSRIHEEFGVKIDLKNLFVEPTIEHLSNYIDAVSWMENETVGVEQDETELIF
ncbi:amino acid adenylation domain-containing protein [Hymenobacter aquaticus]|uniref:Amino acid adenylation domain-containing protein n=1 Tax=Hymenobacter aquaticus TaxID=1867101 RepID=A0A4Z0PX20_9BACT|nr:non-ribosomal peptide synthetase [Hymenobacter aquaticus]TGE21481.1 amino acid adenylation domain-containing protein [Hymenobacter aquaticus]